MKTDVKNLTRKLKIIDRFQGAEWNDESIVKNPSAYEFASKNPWINNISKKLETLEPEHIEIPDNITPAERRALRELKNDDQIIIKKADKTNIMVVMDKEYYRNKLVMKDHLESGTYEQVPPNTDNKLITKQKQLIERHKACLTKKEIQFIETHEWKSANFYVNPKISKCQEIAQRINSTDGDYLQMDPPSSLKGRPIIAGPTSPIKPLSKIMDKILSPIVPLQESYIKDDWDFIKFIPRQLEYDCELLTCDIVSLYTSIPHDLGITAISYWLDTYRSHVPERFTKEFIVEVITFILNNNNFMFNTKMWHQLNGTGMGIDFAGPYACLTVGYLEKVKLFGIHVPRMYNNEEAMLIKEAYRRYVDDGILFWPRHCNIDIFINILNELDDSIKFTIDRGTKEDDTHTINFLDVKVILHQNRRIETEIYYKSTNNHHYLEYDSFHPQHIKDNIPYGMAKKIIVFTSDPQKEHEELERLKGWFLEKNYPLKMIKKAFHNAKLQGPAPNPANKKQVIALTSTYSSNYTNKDIAKQANILLNDCPDDTTRRCFSTKQVIAAHRQPQNLLRLLTTAKFPASSTTNKENGIFLCHRSNCKICSMYLQECTHFQTRVGTWEIRAHLTCNSKYVLYYLQCAVCDEETYTGKTNDFRLRTNNHISCCKSGNGTDKFDNHVYRCNKTVKKPEPLFRAWIFIEVDSIDKLHEYERHLQRKGHDSMNRGIQL